MKQFILSILIIFTLSTSHAAQDAISLAFSFSNQNNCLKAIEYADLSQNRLLKNIIMTRSILDDRCEVIKFYDVVNFIHENPKWSQIEFIKQRAESFAIKGDNKNQILNWFSKNPPQTPEGFKYYAIAAAKQLANPSNQDVIRKAWIYGTFNSQEKDKFLKLYGKFLAEKDHIARIENLLWNENVKEAEDIINLIDKKQQPMYLARIAIIKKDAKLEKLFHALPRLQRHNSGVLYSYLKYKKGLKLPVTHAELSLALHMPNDIKYSNKWWELRSYYIRELMTLHRYREGYKLAVNHNCKDRTNITQAEWLSGWLALSFLHKPQIAIEHFKVLYDNCSRPISLARGAYWIARCHKALHQKQEAHRWFTKAAEHGHTFYGQMAQHELNHKSLKLQSEIALNNEEIKSISKQDGPRIIDLLLQYNQEHLALAYIKNLFSISKDPKYIAFIMDLMKDYKGTSFKVNAAREAAFYGVFKKSYGYPAPYKIQNPIIEVPLIYSIIRQESSFDQNAIDVTDGRGLMQLLPSTAQNMAKSLGIKYDVDLLFKSIDYNIKLGSKHLADHIKYYNGSYLLGIPAYNAGTHRVDNWIARNGDPRKMKNLYQVIDWIERIPFSTTRDYVHRIMENLQVYRSIINKDSSLQIVKDLMHKRK
jgi:soluble lytic murein transglycosylase